MIRGRAGRPRALGAYCVVLGCVACGDGSAPDAGTELQREVLPPGTVELDPSHAPPRSGDGVEPAPERMVVPSDEPDTRYQEFVAALDREIAARCVCQYEELGHPSAEVCHQRLRKPDFAARCELGAFGLVADELGPRYGCFARAREASATCIESRGCEALAECETERDVARRRCSSLVYADVRFADVADSCERLERLGTAGGSCPDAIVDGAAVGTSVFEGDTTGRGNDVTLSCQQDFDNAESADLVVEYRAPAAGFYTFSTENSAFGTQLGVLEGCGGAELACASSDGTSFGSAALALSLAAEQTVLIVLEGYSLTESGYVRLNVAVQP